MQTNPSTTTNPRTPTNPKMHPKPIKPTRPVPKPILTQPNTLKAKIPTHSRERSQIQKIPLTKTQITKITPISTPIITNLTPILTNLTLMFQAKDETGPEPGSRHPGLSLLSARVPVPKSRPCCPLTSQRPRPRPRPPLRPQPRPRPQPPRRSLEPKPKRGRGNRGRRQRMS